MLSTLCPKSEAGHQDMHIGRALVSITILFELILVLQGSTGAWVLIIRLQYLAHKFYVGGPYSTYK